MSNFTEVTEGLLLRFTYESSTYYSDNDYGITVKRMEDSSYNKTFGNIDNVSLVIDDCYPSSDFLTIAIHPTNIAGYLHLDDPIQTIDEFGDLSSERTGDFESVTNLPYLYYDIRVSANTTTEERRAEVYVIWNNIISTNFIRITLEPEYEVCWVEVDESGNYTPYCPTQLFRINGDTIDYLPLNLKAAVHVKNTDIWYYILNEYTVNIVDDKNYVQYNPVVSNQDYTGHFDVTVSVINPSNIIRQTTIYASWRDIRSECGADLIINPKIEYIYEPMFVKLNS